MIMIHDYDWWLWFMSMIYDYELWFVISDLWLWFMIMIYDDVQPSIPIPIPIPIPTPATRPRRLVGRNYRILGWANFSPHIS